jgi:toxin ParE1/3/4
MGSKFGGGSLEPVCSDHAPVELCGAYGGSGRESQIRGFAAIAARDFPWRAIPAEFGVSGFVCRYEQHVIYWKLLTDGTVGIVTILHERMHQIGRLCDELE